MQELVLNPIGVIRTPHTRDEDTPVQPSYAVGVPGRVEVLPEYAEGLDGIEQYSHVFLIFQFDRAGSPALTVVPHKSDTARGVYATRSPRRPNAMGMSLVRLVGREGAALLVEDVDILDGTPLLDVKPYIGALDSRE